MPPRIRRTIPPPSQEHALPRFDLGVDDSSEVQATAQRKALRPYRSVSATWPSASVSPDDTADVAVEDILLETYVEPPPTKRSPQSQQIAKPRPQQPREVKDEPKEEPFRVSFPSVPPPRPSEQARVDALLARHVDIPVEVEVPSIAPVALATPGLVSVFPPMHTPPVFVPQAPPPSGKGRAIVAALAGVLVACATGSGVALATHPAWIAKAKSVASFTKETPVAAAPPQLPPPSTVVTVPPPPPAPPPSASSSQPTIDPSTTLVTFPPYAASHRIFFDGKLVAYDGSPVALKCGHHVLRIGLNGRVRNVTFACGEATTLR